MSRPQKMEEKIRKLLPGLKGKNHAAALTILNRPQDLIRMKVSEFAALCGCDSAQLVRLCQKLGLSGYTSLKQAITQELIEPVKTLQRQLPSEQTPFDQLKKRCCFNFTQTLKNAADELSETTVSKACTMIRKARKILIFGCGSSGLAARDLFSKLLRLGFPVLFLDDAEHMRVHTGVLTPRDLLILISFSGNNAYILDDARIAVKEHTPLLVFTNNPASKLSGMADCMLRTAADENLPRIAAMDSLIAQFFVVDLLCLMLAKEAPQQTQRRILQMFEAAGDLPGKVR